MARAFISASLIASAFALISFCATRLQRQAGARWHGPPVVSSQAAARAAQDELRALGVRFRSWRPSAPARAAGRSCGVTDGVVLLRGPSGVRYSKPPRLDAPFAVKLSRFEVIAQDEAQRHLGRRLVRIDHVGTYVCRSVAGAPGVASQHAFGNAIDVAGFTLSGGRRVVVGRDFVRGGVRPETPAGLFLQALLRRAHDERLFGTILTPDYDGKHANHLHLDGLTRPRWWSRPFAARASALHRG